MIPFQRDHVSQMEVLRFKDCRVVIPIAIGMADIPLQVKI
jgi:hypothetical protein